MQSEVLSSNRRTRRGVTADPRQHRSERKLIPHVRSTSAVHLESQKMEQRATLLQTAVHTEDMKDGEWTGAGMRILERQLSRKKLSCGTGQSNARKRDWPGTVLDAGST
jgi:hypothetical protein